MNRIFKAILSGMLAAAVLTSSACALADSSRHIATTQQSSESGAVFKTVYSIGDEEVYWLTVDSEGTLKAVTSVKNAAEGAVFSSAMYAVDADGAESMIATGEGMEVSAGLADIPTGTVKIKIKLTSDKGTEFESGAISYIDYDVELPEVPPADSWDTTGGVHDPSIVKFPDDDTYYVYSSHHLIFTSEDLINWTKHDFTNINLKDISPKSYEFIYNNIDTNVNGTFWAPDVIYVPEDTDTPYWMYISVSCGLGGRNSAIALMKSPTPLFWADSEKSASIEDAGVVFATKEMAGYKTNAIDAHIYTAADGARYFIWGSFWGGIQGAKLTAEGFVEGVDYSSDEAVLTSCANFGKTLFSQKNGTVGPEGAWMIEHGDYRYMFTSYGWLGSNYNTRVARSPISTDFDDILASETVSEGGFEDANGVKLETEYDSGNGVSPTGYKLIGSYRLGEGASDVVKKNGSNYDIARTRGDAPIYYGPGHNSVIKAEDGDYYYVSHVRKNGVEGAAWLQVRKLIWTDEGWPVVSPVTYSGEKEQKLPRELICGTYDFAGVGATKSWSMAVGHRTNDLPVISSKVTLLEDGSLADGLGSWEYDDDHTITITFAKDGDAGSDEFFKAGDVVTMKALLSYNRDTREYVMALMGTDNNSVAHFATKPMSESTQPARLETTAIDIEKSAGANPELGFDENGDILYGGDPAAMVDGETVYIYVGHDTAEDESGYKMPEWACYSSKDMKDWKYEGVVFKTTDISWRADDISAWASQAVKYGDKYYLYYCTWDATSEGKHSIGVAVSDSPTGPFVDKGEPIVKGTATAPESSGWNDIDPTVWIETDENGTEHRYLAWGNGKFYLCELNEDMVSVKGEIKEQGIARSGNIAFTEGPWLYRRQDENGNCYGQYYVFYAQGWREEIAYAVTDDITDGSWLYKGTLMPPTATSNTNHPSVIDFKGKTYFIYHNGALPMGSGFRRSVAIQEIGFDRYGNVYPVTEMSTGISGKAVTLKTRDGKYLGHEPFVNPSWDSEYHLIRDVIAADTADGLDSAWEIVRGLYEPENENYVSIQSVNKPGLYIREDSLSAVLMHNADGNQARTMTFKTVAALDGGDGVSFESVSSEGLFLTVKDGKLAMSYGENPESCVFTMGEDFKADISDSYAAEGVVSFKVNDGAVFGDVTAYAAEFNNGALVGVSMEKVVLTNDEQTVDMEYHKQNDANMLKVFVWDGMTPVSDAAEVTLTELPESGVDMSKVPSGCTSYYAFEDNLYDSVIGSWGTLTGPFCVWYTSYAAEYADGYNGKALSLKGADQYGVKLGKVISDSTYTVSFRMKANEFTGCTSVIFIDPMNLPAVDAGPLTNNWVSMPISWADANTDTADKWKLKVWSMNNGTYTDLISGFVAEAGKWYQVTVVAEGATGKMYVDGELVGSGPIADVVNATATTYIGVNHWDLPYNGLIDDLYIYDSKALSADEVKALYNATKAEEAAE